MPKIVDPEVRRLDISGVTARLIARGGMEAATIRAIASESGYSKGVIEHYFDNKQALIDGALTWANTCYEQRVADATAGLTGLAALRERLEATIPRTQTTRDEWKVRLLFWGMAAIHPQLRKKQQQRFKQAVDRFELDLDSAMDIGEIDRALDTRPAARRMVNTVTGISIAAVHNQSLYSGELIAGEIDFLVQSVAG